MRIEWTPRRADAALLFVAVIWGSGFIAAELALKSGVSPAMIMTVRFAIASLILLPAQLKKIRASSFRELLAGAGAGVLLCSAFFAQIHGQEITGVSNSAFLTTVNVVIVPFWVWIFTRKRPSPLIFLLAVCALTGAGILTLRPEDGISIGIGDRLVLLSAVLFAMHIAYLGTAARGIDAGLLTFMQMAVSAAASAAVLAGLGESAWPPGASVTDLLPVLYLALFSTCLCFFLQTAAQKRTSAPKAAILLSAEGLCGCVLSVALGFDPLTWHLAAGGALILASIVCASLTNARDAV